MRKERETTTEDVMRVIDLDNEAVVMDMFTSYADHVLNLMAKGLDKDAAEDIAYAHMKEAIQAHRSDVVTKYVTEKVEEKEKV